MADEHPHPHIVNIPEADMFLMAMQEGNWNSFDALLIPGEREEMRLINNDPRQEVTFLQEANWNSFVNLLELQNNRANGRFNEHGHTFLHAAILARLDELAKELVKCMSEDDLALMEEGGHTALFTAIRADMDEVVVLMVTQNPSLVTIRDENGLLPVALAARRGNKEMTRYLFLHTTLPIGILDPQTLQVITALLIDAIISDMYDISIDLLNQYPDLVFIADIHGRMALSVLAKRPPAFPKGQIKAHEILKIVCCQVAKLNRAQLIEHSVYEAVIDASKFGYVEFVTEILMCNHHLQYATSDAIKRDIFRNAILYRRENVYNLMHTMKNKSILREPVVDGNGNNMLHDVGLFTWEYTSKNISGVILRIQSELQWFQEVENCVPPSFKDDLNNDGKTPKVLFEDQHHKLLEDSEKWMKETAQTCMFVTALIAATMLTALFGIPGGIDSESRKPIYLHSRHFVSFMVMDLLSLFFSVCSLIIFLAILTSRYTSQDFLVSLPRKLLFGLVTLCVSVVTFMGASFGGAVFVIGDHFQDHALLPLFVLPFLLYIWMQFPLILKLAYSTYGPSIFLKKGKLKCYRN